MKKLPLAVLLAASLAHAEAVQLSVKNRELIGKGVPMVLVQIDEPIAGFRLKLQRSDGKAIDVKGGGRPGQVREIPLTQPEGKFGYKGELLVNLPDGSTSSMPVAFDAELFGPLRLTFDQKDLDLEQRQLTFRISRPAGKAELRVLMDTGKYAFDGELPFSGEPAGAPLTVRWPAEKGRVMRIELKAYDSEGFFNGVELNPWFIDIPHEEVHFDTGKWAIRPEEEGKLDESFRRIQGEVEKYGHLAKLKLYVGGHTDTVGTLESNQVLSLNRAKSIGSFFRRRGLRIPILYAGFGEQAPLVGTPDETDEIRNRRVQYILSIENPPVTGPVSPKWQPL